jgi:hypothetical protein
MTQKQNTPDEEAARQARMEYIKTKRPFGSNGIASEEIVPNRTPTNPPACHGKSPDGKKGMGQIEADILLYLCCSVTP